MESKAIRNFDVEKLKVVVAENRNKMGKLSANHVAELIKDLLSKKNEIRMIFAAAPSQNEFLEELTKIKSIDWSRIVALHMDEYMGLPEDSGELFSKYLNDHIFSKVNFKKVHFINSQAEDRDAECKRYEALLKESPIDIVCLGIGENGHIAFNDPPVADFNDPYFVKIVELDEKCKTQQVNDAGFKTIDEVPPTAYSLTVPALMAGNILNIVVPGIRKAEAVKNSLYSGVSTKCPATILRTHPNAVLYLDNESASLI